MAIAPAVTARLPHTFMSILQESLLRGLLPAEPGADSPGRACTIAARSLHGRGRRLGRASLTRQDPEETAWGLSL
ncbi:hypothetical protein Snoj_33520 [Streptomyces nojiriensis]|uniref:Uncharacterized protein n=1 Tax=Streptomyces nojiriensis TaxID=66374 RepID=A0ABQ3SMS5_9ACTN|nr:hypothetical protein GCM10010205_70430 [Streptomyces nojiriensis]GHI69434.1 hypothetical protein Snoj_33520 [Streptomyces nojiriensis]